jgi:hypothetical protein
MSESLEEQIHSALKAREDWSTRQQRWYDLRHKGPRRAVLPYPGAPNTRYPLIDASVDKHKPFLTQQIYATETAASFTAKEPQYVDKQSDVSQWFDFNLKHQSNFEREAISAFDAVSQNGMCPVKVFWKCEDDGSRGRLEFKAKNARHIIVPEWTEELPLADLLVDVIPMSVAQYKRKIAVQTG